MILGILFSADLILKILFHNVLKILMEVLFFLRGDIWMSVLIGVLDRFFLFEAQWRFFSGRMDVLPSLKFRAIVHR